MKFQWPQNSTKRLFAETEVNGSVTVELNSEREADLYRFHLYNYRRLKRLNPVFSVSLETNPDTGLKTRITLFKQQEPEVKIVKGEKEKEKEKVA